MKTWKIDVPVLITFFCRPDTLKKVFESVREARPSALLLWQDGPRKNRPDDNENILKCREIVENIDWECTVYKNYHEENMGCDPSTFLAQKWAFEMVDKCIIMEDDRVPSQSFYIYCKELLDKYENDTRISHICGTNLLEIYKDCPYDYFFAPFGSTTWASWRRVAQNWDETYSYLNDNYSRNCYRRIFGEKEYKNYIEGVATKHAATGYQWWETILGAGAKFSTQMAIIPTRNLITDIGLTENSTHAQADERLLPKVLRDTFYMKAYDLEFPLKHPRWVICDFNYVDKLYRITGVGHPWIKRWRKIIYFFNVIRYGQLTSVIKKKIIRNKTKHAGL